MACGSCGAAKAGRDVEYEITYRHSGETERVATLSEANMRLAASPKGGTKRVVPKIKQQHQDRIRPLNRP